jgi:hypothetical protein
MLLDLFEHRVLVLAMKAQRFRRWLIELLDLRRKGFVLDESALITLHINSGPALTACGLLLGELHACKTVKSSPRRCEEGMKMGK